jgi:hypothetical protein
MDCHNISKNRLKYDNSLALSGWRNVIRNAAFYNNMVTTELFNPSSFRLSKGYALAFYTAVALQKRSPYTQRVTEICIRLEETALVKYLNAYYAYKAGVYEASYEEMAYDPKVKAKKEMPPQIALTLFGHLGGSFLILFGGWSLALAAFLHELISGRAQAKSTSKA